LTQINEILAAVVVDIAWIDRTEGQMQTFITRGRYTQDAIRGMLARPEDRAEAVEKLIESAGGKLISYYMTNGEFDFLLISEFPGNSFPSLIAAAAGGGVTGLTTEGALTSAEMKDAYTEAARIVSSFRSAGGR
jgi:uncharacterized protein with GYD domain